MSLENQKIYYILKKENINLQFSDSWFSFFPMNLWSVSNWDLNVYWRFVEFLFYLICCETGIVFFFLVLIFHSMFKKKNVFSNAMLLSINSLQYFVLSLSCHGCLFKQKKFLCLFLGRPAFMYPPSFFSVTIQDIFRTVFSFYNYSVYVFRKETIKLFKYIQNSIKPN